MKKTIVFNVETGDEFVFVNDLDPIDNLINCYLIETNRSSRLHDKEFVDSMRNLVAIAGPNVNRAYFEDLCVEL